MSELDGGSSRSQGGQAGRRVGLLQIEQNRAAFALVKTWEDSVQGKVLKGASLLAARDR